MSKPAKKKLTLKQSFFCKEYIKDFNGTRACIAAGYSKKTAESAASRLLTNVKVQEYIAKAIQKRADKADIDAQWVLDELVKLYKVNVNDFVKLRDDGTPYFDFSQATEKQRAALDTLQIENTMVGMMPVSKIKLGLSSKKSLLEAIGKHVNVNAFKDQVEVDLKGGKELIDHLLAGRGRVNPKKEG